MAQEEWELHDGAAQVGPLTEDHVLRMIAAGIPATTLVRPAGSEKWKSLRAHAPFAMALDRAATATRSSSPTAKGSSARSLRWILVGSAVAVGAILLAVVATRPGTGSEPAGTSTTGAGVATSAPSIPAPTNPLDLIMTKATMAAALAVARPLMTIDKPNDSSPGTFLFALWSIEHLRWSDAAPASDETTYARIRKDIDAERTKRLCVGGMIIQIEAFKQHNGVLYAGLLMDDATNLFHFNAVKSTGDLVERSPARFCGVVTGKYDYANSAGGEGHAVDIVGMFDLPANRDPRDAPVRTPAGRAGSQPQGGKLLAHPAWERGPRATAQPQPEATAPPPSAPATAPPKRGNCGCAAGDMACVMRCSAGQ